MNELEVMRIRLLIFERVRSWKPALFSWPHDTFMEQSWGYAVHEASVRAWNEEGRKTECKEFLLQWATVENINKAITEYGLSDYSHLIIEDRDANT